MLRSFDYVLLHRMFPRLEMETDATVLHKSFVTFQEKAVEEEEEILYITVFQGLQTVFDVGVENL